MALLFKNVEFETSQNLPVNKKTLLNLDEDCYLMYPYKMLNFIKKRHSDNENHVIFFKSLDDLDIFHQFENSYEKINLEEITPENLLNISLLPQPITHYYISKKYLNLLQKHHDIIHSCQNNIKTLLEQMEKPTHLSIVKMIQENILPLIDNQLISRKTVSPFLKELKEHLKFNSFEKTAVFPHILDLTTNFIFAHSPSIFLLKKPSFVPVPQEVLDTLFFHHSKTYTELLSLRKIQNSQHTPFYLMYLNSDNGITLFDELEKVFQKNNLPMQYYKNSLVRHISALGKNEVVDYAIQQYILQLSQKKPEYFVDFLNKNTISNQNSKGLSYNLSMIIGSILSELEPFKEDIFNLSPTLKENPLEDFSFEEERKLKINIPIHKFIISYQAFPDNIIEKFEEQTATRLVHFLSIIANTKNLIYSLTYNGTQVISNLNIQFSGKDLDITESQLKSACKFYFEHKLNSIRLDKTNLNEIEKQAHKYQLSCTLKNNSTEQNKNLQNLKKKI